MREYLKESGQDSKFEEVRLNEVIGQFYINARKPDGNHYKISWLENLRYGLDSYLRSSPTIEHLTLIKDEAFKEANVNFKAATAELKRMGLETVTHHPNINESDIIKLYSSIYCSPNTPSGLYTVA